jgi:TRAP-type uncharacterized transport system fused permease subunit
LLDGGALAASIGYVPAVAYIVLKAVLAIGLWGVAATGYLLRPVNWAERVLVFVTACFLIVALPLTDEIGFALTLAFALWHWLRWRAVRSYA